METYSIDAILSKFVGWHNVLDDALTGRHIIIGLIAIIFTDSITTGD